MTAIKPALAHAIRLNQHKLARAQARPQGNYDHAPDQFGVIAAIHPGPTPTYDVYPDGAQNTGNTNYLMLGLKILDGVTPPSVNDVVLIRRGVGRSSSDRIIVGRLNGTPSPSPVPLGGLDSEGRHVSQLLNHWGSVTDPPPSPSSMGAVEGDWCESTGGHLYFATGAAPNTTWVQKI